MPYVGQTPATAWNGWRFLDGMLLAVVDHRVGPGVPDDGVDDMAGDHAARQVIESPTPSVSRQMHIHTSRSQRPTQHRAHGCLVLRSAYEPPHASVQRVTSPPMCGRPGSAAQPLGPGSPSDAWRRHRSRLPSWVGLAMAARAWSSARLLNDRLASRVTFMGAASAFEAVCLGADDGSMTRGITNRTPGIRAARLTSLSSRDEQIRGTRAVT